MQYTKEIKDASPILMVILIKICIYMYNVTMLEILSPVLTNTCKSDSLPSNFGCYPIKIDVVY